MAKIFIYHTSPNTNYGKDSGQQKKSGRRQLVLPIQRITERYSSTAKAYVALCKPEGVDIMEGSIVINYGN